VESHALPPQGIWPAHVPTVEAFTARMQNTIRDRNFVKVVGRCKTRLPGMPSTATTKADWNAVFIENLSSLSGKVRAEMGTALCTGTTYVGLYIARLSHALVETLGTEQKLPLDETELLLARRLACCYAIEELGIQDQAEAVEEKFKSVGAFDRLNEEFHAFGQQMPVLTRIDAYHQKLGYVGTTTSFKRQLLMAALRASTAYAATETQTDTPQASEPGNAYRQLSSICLGSDGKWNAAAIEPFIAHLVDTLMHDCVVETGHPEQEEAEIKAKAKEVKKARSLRAHRTFFTQTLRHILDPSSTPEVDKQTGPKLSGNNKVKNNFLLHHSDYVLPQPVQAGDTVRALQSVRPHILPSPQMMEDFLGQQNPVASFFSPENLKKIHSICAAPMDGGQAGDIRAVTAFMHGVSSTVRQRMGDALCTGQTYHDLYVVLCTRELVRQLNPSRRYHPRAMQIASSYAILALGLNREEVDGMRARLQNTHLHKWTKRFDLWGQHLPWLFQTLDSRIDGKGYINPDKEKSDCETMLVTMFERIGTRYPTSPPCPAKPGRKLTHVVAHFFPDGIWNEQRAKDAIEVQTAPKPGSQRPRSRELRNQMLYMSRFDKILQSFKQTVEQAQAVHAATLPFNFAPPPVPAPLNEPIDEPIDLPLSPLHFLPNPEYWDTPEILELTGTKRTARDAGLTDW
jgi:hypothetical protein